MLTLQEYFRLEAVEDQINALNDCFAKNKAWNGFDVKLRQLSPSVPIDASTDFKIKPLPHVNQNVLLFVVMSPESSLGARMYLSKHDIDCPVVTLVSKQAVNIWNLLVDQDAGQAPLPSPQPKILNFAKLTRDAAKTGGDGVTQPTSTDQQPRQYKWHSQHKILFNSAQNIPLHGMFEQTQWYNFTLTCNFTLPLYGHILVLVVEEKKITLEHDRTDIDWAQGDRKFQLLYNYLESKGLAAGQHVLYPFPVADNKSGCFSTLFCNSIHLNIPLLGLQVARRESIRFCWDYQPFPQSRKYKYYHDRLNSITNSEHSCLQHNNGYDIIQRLTREHRDQLASEKAGWLQQLDRSQSPASSLIRHFWGWVQSRPDHYFKFEDVYQASRAIESWQ